MNWRHQNVRLRRLEAEAIYIMREVVSEFRNPVMLYSTTIFHRAASARLGIPDRTCSTFSKLSTARTTALANPLAGAMGQSPNSVFRGFAGTIVSGVNCRPETVINRPRLRHSPH
jgi:hypothetical protein